MTPHTSLCKCLRLVTGDLRRGRLIVVALGAFVVLPLIAFVLARASSTHVPAASAASAEAEKPPIGLDAKELGGAKTVSHATLRSPRARESTTRVRARTQ